ncbi:MAG: hypothetical protein GIKADHBN_01855 [Phycisphaerales bacterium]|nr:hypothetical protein [Phycisphaerales bacterium]
MEMLVAIGAVAIITVGVASVFSAIGKTVSGGRRISQLTALSAQIESVMRQDFARMTRDGFLMVRQQLTNTGGASATPLRVPLNAADPNPARARRIDEILFFAKGEFSSARDPVNPAYEATAQAARIYYGHGTRQRPSGAPAPATLTDFNYSAGRLGQNNTLNQYAGDWTLVRSQCLIVDPRQTKFDLVPVLGLDPANPAHRRRLEDKEGQVALQPASLSIFRHLAVCPKYQPASTAEYPLTNSAIMLRTGTRRHSSGLVDIATDTLREIRDVVQCSRGLPGQVGNGTKWYSTVCPDPAGSVFNSDGASGTVYTNRAQLWMDSAWPTQSDQTRNPQFEPHFGAYGGIALQVPNGGRIRVEPRPEYLLEVLRREGKFNSGVDLLASDYRIDQLQLSANGFLRNCSEFIIDWSFGEPDPATGELIWYGLSRYADLDGDDVQDTNEPMLTRPYPFRSFNDQAMNPPFTFPFIDSSGNLINATTGDWSASGGVDRVSPALIYGATAPTSATANVQCLTSYFGYTDTTGADGRPWAWPEFVRVTVKIVDPQDSTTEQTFQYVFRTPGNGNGTT